MPNQMDGRFNQRRNYSLKGRDFTAKVKCTGSAWEAVIYHDSGRVQGISFADEESCKRYLTQVNAGQRLSFVADVSATNKPAFLDVESAKAEMQATNPRKYDPRSVATAEPQPKTFTFSEEQITAINQGILDKFCESHADSFFSCGYNLGVLCQELDAIASENDGLILTDALIAKTINALAAQNMLANRTQKRGDLPVTPYRRLSAVAEAVEQQNQADELVEAQRRRSLPLEEQRALLQSENEELRLGGSTIHRNATQTTQTTSRVNAGRAISDDEKEIRQQLHDGSLTFEDLKAQEIARRAEVARSKR